VLAPSLAATPLDPMTVLPSRYLRGLGITVLCTLIAYPVYPNFDPVNIVMVYLLGTTVAALRLGRGPSALTAIANTVAFDFFFVPPRYSFYVAETQYLFTLGVMLGVALVVANLMVSVRRQTMMAAEREHRTAMLYEVSRELTAAPDASAVYNVARRQVVAAVGGSAHLLTTDTQGRIDDRRPAVPEVQPELAQWVADNGRTAGLGTDQVPSAPCFYLPLKLRGKALGVLVSRPGALLSLEQRQHVEALAGQVSLALERVHLVDSAAQSRAAAERAALRNTLLASISHDLRGPLAAIAGAGGIVAQSDGALDRQRRMTLGKLIEEKARDMTGLLTNILELMRLETSPGAVNSDWHFFEELLGSAVRNNEQRLVGFEVSSAIAADLPLIYVDGQLMVQLLSNLLENATKHTARGTQIRVSLNRHNGVLHIVVEDNGPGFSGHDPERLFEKFERGHGESHISGVGLGLAICRAIVHLHRGTISAGDRPGGGARFEIEIPEASP
jgi:two-component system, OmpR family, sensor histidine kinase KdpD